MRVDANYLNSLIEFFEQPEKEYEFQDKIFVLGTSTDKLGRYILENPERLESYDKEDIEYSFKAYVKVNPRDLSTDMLEVIQKTLIEELDVYGLDYTEFDAEVGEVFVYIVINERIVKESFHLRKVRKPFKKKTIKNLLTETEYRRTNTLARQDIFSEISRNAINILDLARPICPKEDLENFGGDFQGKWDRFKKYVKNKEYICLDKVRYRVICIGDGKLSNKYQQHLQVPELRLNTSSESGIVDIDTLITDLKRLGLRPGITKINPHNGAIESIEIINYNSNITYENKFLRY